MVLRIEKDTRVCTVAEFAKMGGVSKNAVFKWVRRGMPILETGGMYLVPVDDAKEWLSQNTNLRVKFLKVELQDE